jgi:hypothetical protein
MQKLIATCAVALLLLISSLAVFHSMAWSATSNLSTPLANAAAQKPSTQEGTIVLQAAPTGSISEAGAQHTVFLAGSVSGNLWRPHHALQ